MGHPEFPFIGAGEASYFEWAEVVVCFERVPSKAEAAAIGKRVPPPLRDTIEWEGPLLWVASEQGVGRLIKAAYAKSPTKPAKLTTRGKFTVAPGSAYDRFNADIDAWLVEAHAKLPVRVAYRREDLEAGGTRLSDWHHASLEALPALLEALAREPTGRIAKLGQQLVWAAERAKIAIDRRQVARLEAAVNAEKQREHEARTARREARKQEARDALGAPQPPTTKRRSASDLEKSLAKLAKAFPASVKRLRKLAADGLAVRPGATAAALASAEKALGVKLTRDHRALLEAFDGGTIGEITLLGTAKGGAQGDACLETFSNAWCGEELHYVIVAHTGRDHVIAIRVRDTFQPFLLEGTFGTGGGTIKRASKKLDTIFDLVLKAGKV